MKTLLHGSVMCACGSLLLGTAAVAGPPTVDVTVNGSTVTLTRDVPTTVGGPGSGASEPIDIGDVVVMNGTPSVTGSFTVNDQSLPLTVRVLSSTPDGTLQYAIDGGGSVSLGTLGFVTAQPYGGEVQADAGIIRVPITAALAWNTAAPAPEPSFLTVLGFGTAGILLFRARRAHQTGRSAGRVS